MTQDKAVLARQRVEQPGDKTPEQRKIELSAILTQPAVKKADLPRITAEDLPDADIMLGANKVCRLWDVARWQGKVTQKGNKIIVVHDSGFAGEPIAIVDGTHELRVKFNAYLSPITK